MDRSSLTRNADRVLAATKVVGDRAIALREVRVVIPERYKEKGLARLGAEVQVLGIYAMIVGQHYAVSRIPAMIRMRPTTVNTIKIDGDSHLELIFEPGAEIINNLNVIVDDNVAYLIFDEMISKGNVPWFIGYDDLALLFDQSGQFAGMNLDREHAILAMIAASITRNERDRSQYYRHAIAKGDASKVTPAFIKLRSISYGTTNTTSRLVGSYWNDGLTSALVNPAERVENIENLLRR